MAEEEVIEAIDVAAREGRAQDVARMLDEDPGLLSSEWDGETLLILAAYYDQVSVVTLLLERGADVNAPNDSGDTALHLAAHCGHEEVVSILISSGADVFRTGDAGWTVLIHACSSGSVAVVQLLLRAMGGRGLDETSKSGRAALWWACLHGHVDIVQALLIAGADHTIADHFGRTPLQIAHVTRFFECVALIEVSAWLTSDALI
jgi:ankyrin repeat protein